MKQYLTYMTLLLLFTVSCQQASNTAEQSETVALDIEAARKEADSTNNQQELVNERLTDECLELWAERRKLDSVKTDYFTTNVLPKALSNPKLSEQNRKFLLALEAYLNQSFEERASTLTTEQVLFPIFRLKENELGIIGLPLYDVSSASITDVSAESRIMTKSRLVKDADHASEDSLFLQPEFADSLFKNKSKTVYAFTAEKQVKTKVTNFGYYAGACLEYYNYLLDSQPFSSNDKVLFGSRYNLDLAYSSYPEMDELIRNQVKKECYDCPNNAEDQTAFATLKGVEDLYFVYADTFPLNNKLHTPIRGLVMRMDNNKVVYLWYKEVDLFGCSCL